MSIKKITQSIYFTVLMRMLLSAVLSIAVFQGLLYVSDLVVYRQKEVALSKQREAVDSLVVTIQKKITSEKLTFAQAAEIDFFKDNKSFESFIIQKPRTTSSTYRASVAYFLNEYFWYRIDFADVPGYLIVNPLKGEIAANVYYLLSGVISISLFLLLSFFMLMQLFSYMKVIGNGVEIIAESDLLYKIPIKGNNELSQLARGINEMGERLRLKNEAEKRSEQNQRMLITNMSHDLRTPLTSMIGYVGLIKQSTEEDSKVHEYAEIAEKNSLRLEKLINDLFMYTKLISRDIKLNMAKVNINLLISQIVELENVKISFVPCEQKLFVVVDVDKFQRIIDNLLDNVRKYGAKDFPAQITTCLKDSRVMIQIKNKTDFDLSGNISYLTDRLYLGDSQRTDGSSGLGLSIVTELTRLMGGVFEVDFEKPYFSARLFFPANMG